MLCTGTAESFMISSSFRFTRIEIYNYMFVYLISKVKVDHILTLCI